MLTVLQAPLFRFIHLWQVGQWGLSGEIAKPEFRPEELWKGEAWRGKKILSGEFDFAGCAVNFAQAPGKIAWGSPDASEEWHRTLHGFRWIRDVMAFNNTRQSAGHVRDYLTSWMDEAREFSVAERAEVVGERLYHWLANAKFLLAGSDLKFRRNWLRHVAAQALQLEEHAADEPLGLDGVKGLLAVAFCLPHGTFLLAVACDHLEAALARIQEAGFTHASEQLLHLRSLMEIRAALQKNNVPLPEALEGGIAALAGMLRFMCHGDGRFALFNGATGEDALHVEQILHYEQSGAILDVPGYFRAQRGHSLLLVDGTGFNAANPDHHHGSLSFELSEGSQQIVVNCGSYRGPDPLWQKACKATAAHSLLCVDELNLYSVKPPAVTVTDESGNWQFEAVSEGYAEHAMAYSRQIILSSEGESLSGAELFSVKDQGANRHCTLRLRFHLHPDVVPTRLRDGAIQLVLPNNSVWLFQSPFQESGKIEESVYLGIGGRPKRTRQIVLSTVLSGNAYVVEWAFTKL